MKKKLYLFPLICCMILIYFQSISLANDIATITNLRISANEDKVRIVVDADKEVDYQSFALTSPSRIVVDLSNAKLGSGFSHEFTVNSNYVEKVRIGQFDKNTVRVVIESVVQRDDYDIFGIVGGDTPYRVAMDFGNISYNIDKNKQPTENNTITDEDYVIDKDIDIDKDVKKILKGKTITLDPGHGGSDSGALGPTGYDEKTATLRIGLNVAEMLKQAGAKIYITRKKDVDVAPQPATDVEELQARCDVGNLSNSDIFVSIHIDSFSSPSAQGTTGYYYVNGSLDSARLATYIKEGVIEQISTLDRGTKTSNFYVVKHTDMPATLLEVAFISNPDEEAILKSDEGTKKIATGIFNGIVRYFSE